MKRMMLAVGVWVFSSGALADQVLHMPNGGTCMTNSSGHVYGCSREVNPAETAAREAVRAERLRSQELEKCLRTADWRGMPSQSECQSMYGN